MTDLPHFAAPFTFANGQANTVEQDTAEDVQACVFNIASCPQGYRDDTPDFGIPDALFQTVPVNTAALNAAISRWEPRATLKTSQALTAVNAVSIVEAVEVNES